MRLRLTRASFPARLAAFPPPVRGLEDFGLPRAIGTGDGTPFTGALALTGLSELAAWLRLGIRLERTKPGTEY
jgi:hypothetical protein